MRAELRAARDRRVVVIGGANTDLVGIADAPLVERDSNPGHVRVSPGGVARNIAENLVRLGADVEFVGAFGDDEAGRELMAACSASGIGLAGSERVRASAGARYLAIAGPDGDMALALNDMRVLDAMTAEWLGQRAGVLGEAELVVIDANLPAEAIEWVVASASVPVLAEPVSVAKAVRLRAVLDRLAAITPNALEAEVLLEGGSPDEVWAADGLVGAGVGAAFVTAGAGGSAWAGRGGSGRQPAAPTEVVSTTGAGDAYAAGVAYAMLAGLDARGCAALGAGCSAVALASERTVSESTSLDAALAAIGE